MQFNAKPFKEGRDPIIFQHMHDNNKGDPMFSVFNKYACGGTGSTHCNPELDKLIAKASVATGQERVDSWKEIFRIVYEDMVADVWLYHMVGYARVNPRITFKPTMATNSEIHVEDIAFK